MWADDHVRTEEQLKAFEKKAVEHAKSVGKEQALKDFSNTDKSSEFQDGELYIFAYDFQRAL